jgi:DNA replication and repair protein RecF
MILRRIHLRNFRSYGEVELVFSEQCNFIQGNNAQGKSNLLEAIHVLALTRSFRTTRERDLAGYDGDGYEILGEFSDEAGVTHLVTVCYRQQGGKEVALDRKRLQSSGLIGKFPVVHFSPESHRITSGPPAERRRFIDMLLCQSSPSYFANLVEYNRILRQRNALLMQPVGEREKNLAAWSQSLAYHGCRVIAARYQFVNEYAPVLHQAYTHISVSAQPCQLMGRAEKTDLAGATFG